MLLKVLHALGLNSNARNDTPPIYLGAHAAVFKALFTMRHGL